MWRQAWPERPRRRVADGVDAGWRLALSLGLLKGSIIFCLYFQFGLHETAFAIALGVCALPFGVAHFFAWCTLLSWLDQRSWLRAQKMAEEAPAVGDQGRTGE